MLQDVTFGQYYETQSFVHKMDARIKLLALILYVVLIFVVKNFYGFLVVGAFLIVATIFSRVPLGAMLSSVKGILFLILFTVLLNVFFYQAPNETILFWVVSVESLTFAGFMALRLITLVLGSMLLTLTTTPVALTDAIESLLSPLKVIKFPVHELALVMSIALRFIPTLMAEADRIIMAQKARGADFDSGSLVARAKAMIPVLIPLLISAFRRAEELGDAMDSRSYSSSAVRTKYKKYRLTYRDLIGSIICVISLAGVILLNVYAGGIV
ncbi:MAG: energy-coupling factor transporter transmembrane protein EcfT [Clostridia bacterium]|nr:energy-coupling factor transporter transmembrane protein EcfT [Clostridia bacterium]